MQKLKYLLTVAIQPAGIVVDPSPASSLLVKVLSFSRASLADDSITDSLVSSSLMAHFGALEVLSVKGPGFRGFKGLNFSDFENFLWFLSNLENFLMPPLWRSLY